MERRTFVATVGATASVATAGCFLLDPSNEYGESDENAMYPTGADVPAGWTELPDDFNADFGAEFENRERSRIALVHVNVFEDVEEARERMGRGRNGAEVVDEWVGPEDYSLADDAFWYEKEKDARTLFRDSNAVGVSVAYRYTESSRSPARPASQRFAELTHEEWKAL